VDDPAVFAAAARRLLDEPGLRDRLAAGARDRAIAEFQGEAMGRRSMALYSAMLAGVPQDRGPREARPAPSTLALPQGFRELSKNHHASRSGTP
jgi:hypothetical protein